MSEVCRPWRRLFLLALVLVGTSGLSQTVPMTTVQDTVYRADGSPAEGTLIISWPAFTTSGGEAIAAGTASVNLGTGGALAVSLTPNVNATPGNTVYTVIYQLNDGTVKTEYWTVPTTSPATLAEVRTTLGATSSVAQMATQQFVNSALAAKANDSSVVHLSGTEAISGTKQFSVSPSMPTPSQPSDAANKAYVDSAVQNSGSGSYLSTSGGTLTGPLTLSGDAFHPPTIIRKLNQPSELRVSLVADSPEFVVPAAKARITFGRTNGQDVFTGYLMQAPAYESLGWGERGPAYRYNLVAQSDEALLDEKRLADRSPFVDRSAGNALRQLTQDLLPGVFDTSAAQDLDTMFEYVPDPQKTWSQHAGQIAIRARASYRTLNGTLIFSPLAANLYPLSENDPTFNPEGLILQPVNALINDLTMVGEIEPQAYVKDYFVGDGLTTRFYLSQTPFVKKSTTIFDEEYTVSPLELTLWSVMDPAGAISVSAGKLQIAGGTGVDGATTVQYVEQVELGGALVLQHGDVMFNAASSAVLGGLYAGAISIAGCLAGFQLIPNGSQSNIQALVNGISTGPAVTTVTGHHYLLTTRLYSDEIYRRQQIFHSSVHPAGNEFGGAEIPADVRVVLELQDIDPANPATQVAPAAVLCDAVIPGAPDFCTYALVNAANLQCSIAFTRMIQAVDAEVRSALPGQSYITQLVGPLSEGAECNVTSSAELEFYSAYVPASNQMIGVRYRGQGRALARIINPASIAAQTCGIDDGLRGAVRHVKAPPARTAADCENAALAFLDDSIGSAWKGAYETWSDFLPGGAADIFPGDGLSINAPSRGAILQAIVHEVEVTVNDLQGEHSTYKITFANDAAEIVAFQFEASELKTIPVVNELTNTQVGSTFLPALTDAEITAVTSTTVNVDAGIAPATGGGIEVRWSDSGWGPYNDRNLVGRFTTQTFTIPRLSRVQDCYLQQYDNSVPPKYSRYSVALHVDFPLSVNYPS
jgi:hypothetical protein